MMKKLLSVLMILIVAILSKPFYASAESLTVNIVPVEKGVNTQQQEKVIKSIDVDTGFLNNIIELDENGILRQWNNLNSDHKINEVIFVDDFKWASNIISPNKVIGSDGRKLVQNIGITPYKQTVYINQYYLSLDSKLYVYRCSGAVVPKNLGGSRILTAAHCLYKLDDEKLIEGHPVGVSVFTGYNNGNYDEVSSATSIKLPAEYINTLANQYDFGVIDLADDLSSRVGVLDLEVATNRNVKIGGYPADLGQRQYIMSGPATLESNGRLHYTIDTFGGQSGAPILDNVNNRIIGVHSAGYRDLDLNLGAALDSIKILFIKSP